MAATRQTITVYVGWSGQQKPQPCPVEARVFGVWAAHKSERGRAWTVTHLPSGQPLDRMLKNQREASQIAKVLDALLPGFHANAEPGVPLPDSCVPEAKRAWDRARSVDWADFAVWQREAKALEKRAAKLDAEAAAVSRPPEMGTIRKAGTDEVRALTALGLKPRGGRWFIEVTSEGDVHVLQSNLHGAGHDHRSYHFGMLRGSDPLALAASKSLRLIWARADGVAKGLRDEAADLRREAHHLLWEATPAETRAVAS